MYALIENGAVVQYPYSLAQLQQANPNVSFAVNNEAAYEEFGMYRVYSGPVPPYSEMTHRLVEATPTFDAQVQRWIQTWQVVALAPEDVEQRKQLLMNDIVAATQNRLDTFARTRNYDGILSLCTYATSPTQKFADEGQYGITARDATWAKLYEILAEVQAGTRPMPSNYFDIEPDLPPLAWPTP